MNDLCMLSKVRSFMQYGFSIDDSYRLVMSEGIDQTKEMLLRRSEEIQENLRRQMANLQSLYIRMNLINRALDNIGKFSVKDAEEFDLLEQFDRNGNLTGDFEQYSGWINQTVTYPFSILSGKAFSSGAVSSKMMGLSLATSQKSHDIQMPPDAIHISPGKCVFTCFILNSRSFETIAENVNHYLKCSSLSLRGDILQRTVSTLSADGEYSYLVELWIPIN